MTKEKGVPLPSRKTLFMINKKIIVIEDNDTMRLGIVESLRREGFKVHAYDNGPDGLKEFKKQQFPLAIIDVKMEPMNGLEILKKIKENSLSTEVLMISAYGTVETAVEAMQYGATDFLTKPFSPDELRIRVKNIFNKIENELNLEKLIEQNKLLTEDLSAGFDDIVGESTSIKNIFEMIDKIAAKESSVLIEGDSGTGKELIARAIHFKSNRSEKAFIRINCGALNDNLLESELFGHERGAFTGAIRQKKGRFELADQGTLFLDEIGDVSPAMQVKLLRVLQEGEFERVGGEETISSNTRIIAATNRDLQKLIVDNQFREDLYYRLSVIPLTIPPLRERKEDIPALVEHFLKKISKKNRQPVKTINEEGIKLLYGYYWPGNIRELANLIERLIVISPSEEIGSDLIAQHLCSRLPIKNGFENLSLENAMYEFEKNLIIQAMKKSNGVKNRAAKILGIKTSSLYYKLEKFELF